MKKQIKSQIKINCTYCNKEIIRNQSKKTRELKKGRPCNSFCTKECEKCYDFYRTRSLVSCLNCGKRFYKYKKQIEKSPRNFCSSSCSAKINNKNIKRFRKIKYCKYVNCTNEVRNGLFYCLEHKNNCKTFETQRYCDIPRDSNRDKSAYVRNRARTVYTKQNKLNCRNCGYHKHIEVCHIKAINQFDSECLVSEINHPNNLIGLCPNCHWEFDNKILTIEKIKENQTLLEGFEPSIVV